MKKKLFQNPMVGIDIGATKVLTLVINELGGVEATRKQDIPLGESFDGTMGRVADTVESALSDAGLKKKKIGAIGVGAPSPIDIKTGVALYSPNLNWKNVPLKAKLQKMLALPVFPDNDVNLGTFGEFALGAGRGAANLAGFFVGTGIGGGVIIDGNIIHGKNMAGGELGHIIVIPDGPLCGCGNRGCLESVSSRLAIARDLASAIEKGVPSALSDLINKKNSRIKSGALKKAYLSGDTLAVSVLDKSAFYLGLAVASVINIIGPEIIVIGGGVFEALGKELLPIVIQTTSLHTFGPAGDGVKIVLAQLGDHAVAMGAASYAARMI